MYSSDRSSAKWRRLLPRGVGLLLVLVLLSCGREQQFRFVFMTDIHVQPEMRGAEGFRAAIEAVNSLRPRPAFVITGGDLVMDALEQNFARADSLYTLYLSLIKEFQMPVYHCIGNHEVFGLYVRSGVDPSHPEFGKEMFKKRIGEGRTYRSFDYGGWHFVLLDAVGFTPERTYIGHVDSAQLAWLASDLAQVAKDTPIVLALHIPLFSVSEQFARGPQAALDRAGAVTNALEVLKVCSGHHVPLVLQGHMHDVEEIVVRGTHFITAGAVSGAWWNGPYRGFGEGFAVVDVKGTQFTWQYREYGWEAAAK
ncbi:MAG: metallophosphoesterase [candidate division KSB1 bacterium]|nr:metallophosphoesterase [candidate division KSB1 bacterium]